MESENIPFQERTPPIDEPDTVADEVETDVEETRSSSAPQEEAWKEVLSAGLDFLGKMSQAMQGQGTTSDKSRSPLANVIRTNEKTGTPEVRTPLPDEATAEKFGDLLTGFEQMFKEFGKNRG
ncbi:MAG: hypothetical protein KC964_02515 [Candidatus Omnitrophica bacterium]|nr:hypothetical protein [Candidatus Omnitrophota bacterium]